MENKQYQENVQKEYQKYREHILELPPEQIYERCGEIYFYHCMYDYFMCNEELSNLAVMQMKTTENLIAECWKVYLKYEGLSCGSWEDIDELWKVWLQSIENR